MASSFSSSTSNSYISVLSIGAAALVACAVLPGQSRQQDSTMKLFASRTLHHAVDVLPEVSHLPGLGRRHAGIVDGMPHPKGLVEKVPRFPEQMGAHRASADIYDYSENPQGFHGQIALLGSLAAVALTSLAIATMALTSGMIGLAGVAFGLYSVTIALQWCIPFFTQAMPVQVLALPFAICTFLAYKRQQERDETPMQFSNDNVSVITPYKPQRTIPPTSNVSWRPQEETPSSLKGSVYFKESSTTPLDKEAMVTLAQQRAYLRQMYMMPSAARPTKMSPVRSAWVWIRNSLFGKTNPDAEAGFPFQDTEQLRRAKRALERAYRLASPPETRPEELVSPEEFIDWPQRPAYQMDLDEARKMLQRIYDMSPNAEGGKP